MRMGTSLSPSRSILRRTGRRARAASLRALAAALAAACLATPAAAHGFGQRYDLPIPLSFYLVGAAAAVVVSFLIVGLFVREAPRVRSYPRIDLFATPLGRWLASPSLALALKFLALAGFIITILAGFRGDQNPYRNIAPTLVWTIAWVGLAYVCAFVGNVWAVINPWRTIFESIETIDRGISGRPEFGLRLPYPAARGFWRASIRRLAFSWIDLVYPNPAVPYFIAWLALAYSLLTFACMFLSGRECWLERGEVFTAGFGTFARFAPIEIRTGARRGIWLRPFGAGLIEGGSVSTSMMAFVLLLLSSVLYDGALGTPEWGRLEVAIAAHLSALADFKLMAIRTAGLFAFWLVFCGAYVGVSAMMSAVAQQRLAPLEFARSFAFTLVPIAIGYHFAHYFTFLLIQGQYIIPLASDPFGFGWNLFGTAGYRLDIAIVDARFAWLTAVAAILIRQIAEGYLAHVKGMQVPVTRRAALRSQVPLTALMVVYTFVSLSILAEPIVERRVPAQPTATVPEALTIPEDALIPEPGTGRLQPVGAGRSPPLKLTYRVLGSAFHDGTRATFADLLYAYMFAYRWAVPGEADSHYDPVIAAATAPLRRRLAGVRVAGVDTASKSFRVGDVNFVRELVVVDVYANISPEDPEQDAVFAPPWSTLPWHLLVLMEEAVSRDWAAFSQAEATRRGVEWLDLVRSDTLKGRLAALTDQFEQEGFRPEILRSQVSAEEARKRWAAMAAFYRDHGHFLVTNGPYQLKSWAGDSATLQAFRDLSYPLGVGSYDAYAVPRRGYVTKVEHDNGGLRLSADIEILVK